MSSNDNVLYRISSKISKSCSLPTDSDTAREQKVNLVLVTVACAVLCPFWSGIYFLLGYPLSAAIPMCYAIIAVVCLTLFFATKNANLFKYPSLTFMLALPFALQWSLGGFTAACAVSLWAVVAPMAAITGLGRRPAIPWFVAYVILLVIFCIFDGHMASRAAHFSPTWQAIFWGMDIIMPSVVLYLALHFFVSQRDNAFNNAATLLVNLRQRSAELEQENSINAAAVRRLEDLNRSKDLVYLKLASLYQDRLPGLKKTLDELLAKSPSKNLLDVAVHDIDLVHEFLKSIVTQYSSECSIRSKRILLADTDHRNQAIAKMALRGTGVELDAVSNVESGKTKVKEKKYDLICFDSHFLDFESLIRQQNPEIKSVFMTQEDIQGHLATIKANPHIYNVVCRDPQDRIFTIKNILTTASKLLSQDIFGLEKYLAWGVEVIEHPITCSADREPLVDQMVTYLGECGIRGPISRRCVVAAEELIMNAVYDAPMDKDRKPLYNHLPRTVAVELAPEQQARFRYACDGMLVALSVEDLFGGLTRDLILDYLIRCYSGATTQGADGEKAGAGQGLFQVMNAASLTVFNVRERAKTEVIALFNVDIQVSRRMNERSFHFFYE